MKGICSSERIKMMSLMLLVGTTAAIAQNSAGDYTAGTTALWDCDDQIMQVCTVCGEAVLRHCRCGGCRRCYQCVYQDEQRGAGCQEVHHDDRGSLYLPCGRCTSIAVVLWCNELNCNGHRL